MQVLGTNLLREFRILDIELILHTLEKSDAIASYREL